MVFSIRQSAYTAMVNHCLHDRPYEACGLLSGKNGQADTVWKMDNVLRSTTAFEMDPIQLDQTFQKIEGTGAELLGIYHSHPTASADPSAADIANANYPEAVYVIVSLVKGPPVVGCYRILNKSRIIPLRLSITPD
jgi:proteasome lid subunit RPN8/RPN11